MSSTSVKRVVLTSSSSAVCRVVLEKNDGHITQREPRKLTEADWNEESLALCHELGKNAPPSDKYMAGKVAAERGRSKFTCLDQPALFKLLRTLAAWNFVEEHKTQICWDLVALLPTWVSCKALPFAATPFTDNICLPGIWCRFCGLDAYS
jgi:hypothetical protein